MLHARGSNASGFVGGLDDTSLVLRGNIGAVLEPGTSVLVYASLLVLARARRSQPCHEVA